MSLSSTIDKLAEIDLGMSEEKVTAVLGVPPYDVFHDVANNCKILVWYYKHKGHIISSKDDDKSPSLSDGQSVFFNLIKFISNFLKMIDDYSATLQKKVKKEVLS